MLLTSHTGFKGGWLALRLKQMGARVTDISLPPNTTPNLFELARVAVMITTDKVYRNPEQAQAFHEDDPPVQREQGRV